MEKDPTQESTVIEVDQNSKLSSDTSDSNSENKISDDTSIEQQSTSCSHVVQTVQEVDGYLENKMKRSSDVQVKPKMEMSSNSNSSIASSEHMSDTSSVNSDTFGSLAALKDYGPMKHLMNLLPARVQRNVTSFPLKMNCIDATDDHIVLGCNVDVIYLYSHKSASLQRLKCSSSEFRNITSVSIILSVDLMIAAGSSVGAVIAFKVPQIAQLEAQMEKFVVKKMHHNPITCLKWSQNAMKLYSADSSGLIVCTNITYDKHGSYSEVVLKEPEPIVQMDYCHQVLLVSTTARTIVCYTAEDNRILQVGFKERKCHGRFGAQFYVSGSPAFIKNYETLLYTSRPGLRVWKANASGVVMETIMFKDVLMKDLAATTVLGSDSSSSKFNPADQQFGLVRIYQKQSLVIWNEHFIFIIDPVNGVVLGSFQSVQRIVDLCVTSDEILMLNDAVIRLSTRPDIFPSQDARIEEKTFKPDFSNVQAGLKDLGSKFQEIKIKSSTGFIDRLKKSGKIISSVDPSKMPIPRHFFMDFNAGLAQDTGSGIHAAGTGEKERSNQSDIGDLLPVRDISELEIDPPEIVTTTEDTREMMSDINCDKLNVEHCDKSEIVDRFKLVDMNDSEELVYKPKKRKGKRKITSSSSEKSSSVVPCLENENVVQCETVAKNDNSSNVVIQNDANVISENSLDNFKEKILNEITNVQQHQTMNEKDREDFLAQILKLNDSNDDCAENSKDDVDQIELTMPEEDVTVDSLAFDNDKMDEIQCHSVFDDSLGNIYASKVNSPGYDSTDGERTFTSSPAKTEPNMIVERESAKPSNSLGSLEFSHNRADSSLFDDFSVNLDQLRLERDVRSKFNDSWIQHEANFPIVCVSASSSYVVCVDNRDNVFYSSLCGPGLMWHQLDYHANEVAISISGSMIWRIYKGILYVCRPGTCNLYKPNVSSWIEVTTNVHSVAIDDTDAWILKMSGQVVVKHDMVTAAPYTNIVVSSDIHLKIKELACLNGVVWALSNENRVYCRTGIDTECYEGTDWLPLKYDSGLELVAIALSDRTGWGVDGTGCVWFRAGVTSNIPEGINNDWWQVKISSYIYQDVTRLQNFKDIIDMMNPEKLFSLKQTSIACSATQTGFWFCVKNSKTLWTNNTHIVGHLWQPFSFVGIAANTTWLDIRARCVNNDTGSLWFVMSNNELFNVLLPSKKMVQVQSPNQKSLVKCISPTHESLWVLMDNGEVWIRSVSSSNPCGSGWEFLSLFQIEGVKLTHISCSHDVVWACDECGDVYMRIGSVRPPSSANLPPAWIPVENDKPNSVPQVKGLMQSQFNVRLDGLSMTKVYVGPSDYIVWAIDNKNNVYVRGGILEDFLLGTSWIYVSGVHATDLSISDCAVWVIGLDGYIYRRYGISDTNHVGDYWKQVPGKLQKISATVDDEVWGLTLTSNVVQHYAYQLNYGNKKQSSLAQTSFEIDDWEVVDQI
ncbi:Uncharacterised protein g907 [Pycnogonum litorale]